MITDQSSFRRALRLVVGLPPDQGGKNLHDLAEFAVTDLDREAIRFCRSHLAANGVLPQPETITQSTGLPLPSGKEPLSYEMESARLAYVETSLRSAVDAASSILNGEKNPDSALTNLTHDLLALSRRQTSARLTDLRKAERGILAHYSDQLEGKVEPPMKTGWPSLDSKGAIRNGDLVSIVGKSGAGKTYCLLRLALWRWGQYGCPTIFVTQEMSSEAVEARALPMVAGVPVSPLSEGRKVQDSVGGLTHDSYVEKLTEAAKALKSAESPFLIYDTKMAGTVSDVETIAAMYGVDQVYIDGAYLLSHPDRRLGRYQKVAENLDLMKDAAMRGGMTLFSTWQFKRGAGKGGADEEADLDDIGYSNAVSEFSSVVVGLLSPPKSVSQMKQRTLTIMKGRNGEAGSFNIHFDFATSNFEEVQEDEMKADISYI